MFIIGYCFDDYFTYEDFLYVFVRLLSSILFIKSIPLKISHFDLNDYLIGLRLLYMKEVEMNDLLNCFPKMQ